MVIKPFAFLTFSLPSPSSLLKLPNTTTKASCLLMNWKNKWEIFSLTSTMNPGFSSLDEHYALISDIREFEEANRQLNEDGNTNEKGA